MSGANVCLFCLQGKPKELKLASQTQPAVAPETRQACAARLIALIDSASKAAANPIPQDPQKGSGKGKAKKRKAAEMEATPTAAAVAVSEAVQAARLESAYLAEIASYVAKVSCMHGAM